MGNDSPNDSPNDSRSCLVTGAGSGIGLAVAAQLRALGHRVWAGARREAELAALRDLGAEVLTLDVCDIGAVQQAAQRVAAGGGEWRRVAGRGSMAWC